MAIKFRCECGKELTAKDGTEGKRAKCPACQRVLTIPSPSRPEEPALAPEEAGASGGLCPNCKQPMPFEAVLCVQCGFDLRTRSNLGFSAAASRRRRRITVSFPLTKVAVTAGIAGLLAAAWFLVIAPMFDKMRMANATGYVTNGDLKKAITAFEELRPKLSGEDLARAELWLRQLPLEIEKNKGRTLDNGNEVESGAVNMEPKKLVPRVGALVCGVKITNNGKTPLTLRSADFYLRGIGDIVVAAVHDDNSLDGVVVPPGESKEGKVVFRTLPKQPVLKAKGTGMLDTMGGTYYYIHFNDGEHYVKRMLQF